MAIEEKIDSSANSVMGILCYIGILVFVPYVLVKEKTEYLICHIRQGIGLLLLYIVCSIIGNFLNTGIFAFLCFIFSILGILNAVRKKVAVLPLIGQFFDNMLSSVIK